MRIGYMSDLHLCFNDDADTFISSLRPDCDLMLLAGDITDGHHGLCHLKRLCEHLAMPVVMVPGNHEYYNYVSPEMADEALRALCNEVPNLTFLSGGFHQVPGGPRILGTTLWYRATPEMQLRNWSWPDFRHIGDLVAFANDRFIADEQLLMNVEDDDIVVSHMLPTRASIDPRYAEAPNNELFLREVGLHLRDDLRPKFWVHGHTHASVNTVVNQTRVLCNPRGIDDDGFHENPSFSPNMMFIWEPKV